MDLLQGLLGSGSMESHYLQIIALLDGAETIAVGLIDDEAIDENVVLQIARAKQTLIEEFAKKNRTNTLESLEKKFFGEKA